MINLQSLVAISPGLQSLISDVWHLLTTTNNCPTWTNNLRTNIKLFQKKIPSKVFLFELALILVYGIYIYIYCAHLLEISPRSFFPHF